MSLQPSQPVVTMAGAGDVALTFELLQLAGIAAMLCIALIASPLAARIIAPVDQRNDGRDRTLDGLRAVAAIGVVGCHINQHFVSMSGAGLPPEIGDHIGILGVQLFFGLTAYLFVGRALAARLDPLPFLVGRVYRIVPLYLVVCLAALLMAWWYTRDAAVDLRLMAYGAMDTFLYGFTKPDTVTFRGLNMLTLMGISWTLSYEWMFYLLLVPLAALWILVPKLRWPMIATVAVLALYEFDKRYDAVIWAFFLPGALAAFVVGRVPAALGQALLFAAIPAVALIIFLPGYWTLLKLGLVTVVFLGVLCGRPRMLEYSRLKTLGIISYSIYLLQYLVIYPAVQTMYGHPWLASFQARVAFAAAAMAFLVVISAISYRYIEVPFMAAGSRSRPPASTAGSQERSV